MSCDDAPVQEISIRGDMIRLGQLLKLASIVGSGGDAKAMLVAGLVTVNGVEETRRGRQLHDGDVIDADGETVRVVAAN